MGACYSAREERISRLYDLKPGDHIKVKKLPIYHHMIVVKVVSETTIRVIHNNKKGVKEKDLQYTPKEITLLVYECPYSRWEIIMRAREHIGESYNLLWSNCEHLATKVRTGVKQSLQVQNGVAVGTGVALVVGAGAIASVIAAVLLAGYTPVKSVTHCKELIITLHSLLVLVLGSCKSFSVM